MNFTSLYNESVGEIERKDELYSLFTLYINAVESIQDEQRKPSVDEFLHLKEIYDELTQLVSSGKEMNFLRSIKYNKVFKF